MGTNTASSFIVGFINTENTDLFLKVIKRDSHTNPSHSSSHIPLSFHEIYSDYDSTVEFKCKCCTL